MVDLIIGHIFYPEDILPQLYPKLSSHVQVEPIICCDVGSDRADGPEVICSFGISPML